VPCYLYVDGESHYVRSEECWKKIHGTDAELTDVVHADKTARSLSTGIPCWGGVTANDKAKFFFDGKLLWLATGGRFDYMMERGVYFTSVAGGRIPSTRPG
jgi:hypothetical protein